METITYTLSSFDKIKEDNDTKFIKMSLLDELKINDDCVKNFILPLVNKTLDEQYHNKIAELAYYLWQSNGEPQGRDLEFWVRAKNCVLYFVLTEMEKDKWRYMPPGYDAFEDFSFLNYRPDKKML